MKPRCEAVGYYSRHIWLLIDHSDSSGGVDVYRVAFLHATYLNFSWTVWRLLCLDVSVFEWAFDLATEECFLIKSDYIQ